MNAEYLVVDDDTQGEKVEHVRKIVPYVGRPVLPGTFCVKSI